MSDTAVYDSVQAEAPKRRADFGNDFPEHAPREPRPIDTALMHAGDRLDRLEHVLEGPLVTAINALEARLEYVLTPGATDPGPTNPDAMLADPSPEDRRSTIARRISTLAERTDTATDRILGAVHRLEVITAGVEA